MITSWLSSLSIVDIIEVINSVFQKKWNLQEGETLGETIAYHKRLQSPLLQFTRLCVYPGRQ